MAVICDIGAVYALYDADDMHHASSKAVLEAERGLADATVVATADRLQIEREFTVDQRHFRAIQPRGLRHFIILPADQEPS